MERYSFSISWSEKDGEYLATCPAFPGLSAFGETQEEALAEAKIALELFVESFKERGLVLPRERSREEYSGQFRLRLSSSLHRQAASLAASEGQSLNSFIALAVQAKVSEENAERAYTSQLVNQIATCVGDQIAEHLFLQPVGKGFREYVSSSRPVQFDWTTDQITSPELNIAKSFQPRRSIKRIIPIIGHDFNETSRIPS